MRTAIFGAGSIGCFVGAHLLRAGVPTTLIARAWLAEAIAESGLRITQVSGPAFELHAGQVPCRGIDILREVDLVIVTVKSAATETIAREIASQRADGAGLIVLSLQNGIGNAAMLRKHLTLARVLGGMVPYNVAATGTRFHRGTEGDLMIEALDDAGPRVAHLLRQAGLATRVVSDIQAVLWGKLLLNLNNAINALSGIPLRAELSRRGYRRILAAQIREALAILRLAGIRPARVTVLPPSLLPAVLSLPDGLFLRLAKSMLRIDAEARSSMADDLAAGRATEIDYLQGEIVRLAEAHDARAALNARMLALVRETESRGRGSPNWSEAELAAALAQG